MCFDDISCKGSVCKLKIRDRNREVIATTLFSKRHYKTIGSLLWNLHRENKAPRNHRTRKYLHQIVMGDCGGLEVDHINGNRLDNRDGNLRFVTRTQNMWNLPLSKRNRSGCRGVWWDKVNDAWQVKICVNRKQIFLGRFKDYDEAVKVRKKAEKKYYGQYTRK